MKRIFYFILLLPFFTSAQDISADFLPGAVSIQDLQQNICPIDTTANAFYIDDFGYASLNTNDDGYNISYMRHAKIKMLNKKGFDEATIEIILKKSDTFKFEKISEIKAVTYYLENGVIQRAELKPTNIYKEELNKYTDRVKFTMPHLEDGCIIEYSYNIISPYIFNLSSWDFQESIPKTKSLFRAVIPGIFNYNASLKGTLKLSDQKATIISACFNDRGITCDCSDLRYTMLNIPAFKTEEYMTNPKNFISSVSFELMEVFLNGATRKFTKTWENIYQDLKADSEFFGQIKRGSDLFKTEIDSIKIVPEIDELSKAKSVYSLVKNWFNWNNVYGYGTENGVKKAYTTHTGNIGDINLALVAALQYAGIKTEPVLLSTRNNGLPVEIYPVITDFNYVIAKVNIDDNTYLLDATDKTLDFGLLPYQALNGKGRAISKDSTYWVNLIPVRKQRDLTQLDLKLKEDGKFYGVLKKYFYDYAAYDERKSIQKFATEEEFINNLDEKQPRLKINNYKINNLNSPSEILIEEFEIELDGFDNLNTGKLFLNPFILIKRQENPFKLVKRDYPVDFFTPTEEIYILNLEIPEKFNIINLPESVALKLPNDGGKYLFSASKNGNMLTISQNLSLKPIFQSNEYPYLKELMNKMILNNKVDLILERSK
ncbi:DUF3857 domain-containing protein [Pedobacter cryophilus]|uniref:DUF3857 domain-containing protein n=1 Tax=Pedobacter cryophilus TaxID=2571271 RepID=A0A4U1BXJ3_9SPHI|nr:DUF3857 domain-containing protein [Pedobacter cryophilus]TKB97746.1 DUF3857 domain-containing protein [Pedobacter cryophilus]